LLCLILFGIFDSTLPEDFVLENKKAEL